MIRRHILTSIAVAQAAIWGFGVYFEHNRGGLRFLDRIESATIDIRTLARGKRVPPDLVTIVAIDDDAVRLRGAYPLPRIDLAKIVDTIAISF
jgi:adenylate cyclase